MIDDFDEKLDISDTMCIQELFVPIVIAANSDKPSNQKTFFLLEKLNIINPSMGRAEKAIALFDCVYEMFFVC